MRASVPGLTGEASLGTTTIAAVRARLADAMRMVLSFMIVKQLSVLKGVGDEERWGLKSRRKVSRPKVEESRTVVTLAC
jgi:hypothetical protein